MDAKTTRKNWQVLGARQASLDHLGLINDPLMILTFHNGVMIPKGKKK